MYSFVRVQGMRVFAPITRENIVPWTAVPSDSAVVSTSTVEVQANSVHVATDSSDRSVDINLTQIGDTPTRGRNPISLIMTLPGTQSLAQSYDYRGWNGGGIPGVNGGQQGQIILNMDGAASQDSGNLNTGYINPSIDAIGEVRLLISNYTAEYGGGPPPPPTPTPKKRTAPP